MFNVYVNNITDIVFGRKSGFFVKVKDGENFNRMNTGIMLRITI